LIDTVGFEPCLPDGWRKHIFIPLIEHAMIEGLHHEARSHGLSPFFHLAGQMDRLIALLHQPKL
jgi:hypothetical protein